MKGPLRSPQKYLGALGSITRRGGAVPSRSLFVAKRTVVIIVAITPTGDDG